MINEVRLMGFFGADPEERETNGGEYKYARFPLSLYRRSPNKEVRGNFIQCEAWNKTGEIVMNMGKKRERAIVEGELRVDVWKTDEGETRSRTYLRVNRIIFLDKRASDRNVTSTETSDAHSSEPKQERPKDASPPSKEEDEFKDLFNEFEF